MKAILGFLLFLSIYGCSKSPLPSPPAVENIVLDSLDTDYGYYSAVKPKGQINSVLFLLPGFGQKAEDIFHDSDFHKFAAEKNILVIGFAGRLRLTADSLIQEKLTLVLQDILKSTKVSKDQFVLGGFSAGGVIALRYTELCLQHPDKFPIQPKGVFMVDSPIDLYHLWEAKEYTLKNSSSEIVLNEANWVQKMLIKQYGATPSDSPETYIELSPFSIDKNYGTNEKALEKVAVRVYHDIDIMWRITQRNQTPRFSNFIATSELINRLLLLGNDRAEVIQSYQTGYRRDGQRHPHSWSIVDEEECLEWMESLF